MFKNLIPYTDIHEMNLDWIIAKVKEYISKYDVLEIDFNNLKEYVDGFIDNLDIQDAVNNKLDEMYESGQLTDLITQWLNSQGLMTYNTIDDLKQSTNIVDGQNIMTLGKDVIGDKLGRIYKIRQALTTDIIDDFNIIQLSNPSLIAEKINMWGNKNVLVSNRYYINSQLGDDNFDGLTQLTAFKTLDRFFEIANSQNDVRGYITNSDTYEVHNISVFSNVNLHLQDLVGNSIINFNTDERDVAVYGGHWNIGVETNLTTDTLTLQVNGGNNFIYFDDCFLVAKQVYFKNGLNASGISSLNRCSSEYINFSYGDIKIANGFNILNTDGAINGINLTQANFINAGVITWSSLLTNLSSNGVAFNITNNSNAIIGNVPQNITNKYSKGIVVNASRLNIQQNRFDGFANVGTTPYEIYDDAIITFTNESEFIATEYKKGDNLTINGIFTYGYITGGATSLRLILPLNKSINRLVSNIALEISTSITIRGNAMLTINSEDITVASVIKNASGLYIQLTLSSAASITNNTPISVVFKNATLSFN